MKKLVIVLVKIGASLAILGYVLYRAIAAPGGKEYFDAFVAGEKNWSLLALALLITAAGIVLTMIRWCYLVRAVGIRFRMHNAVRIGFIGFLFNLMPLGIVAGDLVKAIMLARENRGQRAKAVASVIMDRIVGLYILFVVASAGLLLTGFYPRHVPDKILVRGITLRYVCDATLLLTAVGTIGIAVVLCTAVLDSRWVKSLARLPRIGPALGSLMEALRIYRRDRAVMLATAVMSVGVHCLLAMGVYTIALGLPGEKLTVKDQFVVYPISSVFSTIPLPFGPFELAFVSLSISVDPGHPIDRLQAAITRHRSARADWRIWGHPIDRLQAAITVLVFRLMNVLLATIGLAYWLAARREVAEVMHEVAEESQAPP